MSFKLNFSSEIYIYDNRKLEETTTTTATRTSQKKMRKTIAVYVRYNSLHSSWSSSAKQEREMSNFCVVIGTRKATANFSYFHLELNAVFEYLS